MTQKPTVKVDAAHSDNIWSISWTSRGHLASGGLDGSVKLWSLNHEANELKCSASTPKRNVGITSITSVADGSLVLACYQDSLIGVFDSGAGLDQVSTVDCGFLEALSICMSPGDDVVASGSLKGVVNIWSMLPGHERLAQLPTKNKAILSCAFNIDGNLATASIDGFVNIFDIETKQIIHKIEAHALPARCVTFSPDGNLVMTVSDDRLVTVYDTVSCKIFASFSLTGFGRSVDISSDRRHFVVGCSDGSTSLWDLGMLRRLDTHQSHKEQVWSVGFDRSDGRHRRFASAGDDGLIQLYE